MNYKKVNKIVKKKLQEVIEILTLLLSSRGPVDWAIFTQPSRN